jgi:hypothetical protein
LFSEPWIKDAVSGIRQEAERDASQYKKMGVLNAEPDKFQYFVYGWSELAGIDVKAKEKILGGDKNIMSLEQLG